LAMKDDTDWQAELSQRTTKLMFQFESIEKRIGSLETALADTVQRAYDEGFHDGKNDKPSSPSKTEQKDTQ